MFNQDDWDRCIAFHGRACPGLAIGFKAAEGALAELGLEPGTRSADEELVCVTENDMCGVDAIQELLSCTYGKGNLIPRLRGKNAFSFFLRGTGKAVRLCLMEDAGKGLPRAQMQQFFLEASYKDIFDVSRPRYRLPSPAQIFESHICCVCGEKTAEPMLRFQDGEPICLDCYKPYQREGF